MQLPVVGVKALQPRGLSANIQDRGQAEEPERRRTGAPWRAQSCWCRGAGSLCQDDGGRAQRLRSASSKGPLGQEAQAEVAQAHGGILLLPRPSRPPHRGSTTWRGCLALSSLPNIAPRRSRAHSLVDPGDLDLDAGALAGMAGMRWERSWSRVLTGPCRPLD